MAGFLENTSALIRKIACKQIFWCIVQCEVWLQPADFTQPGLFVERFRAEDNRRLPAVRLYVTSTPMLFPMHTGVVMKSYFCRRACKIRDTSVAYASGCKANDMELFYGEYETWHGLCWLRGFAAIFSQNDITMLRKPELLLRSYRRYSGVVYVYKVCCHYGK